MEFIQLLSFYQIVTTGSFSKASKNVFRSQSAISHQIKNLENELKIKLFERLSKRVKLTEEGEILFNVISTFFNDLDNLKKLYEDMEYCQEGKLTIALSSSIMRYWFSEIIKKFIEQFPKIKLKFITYVNTLQMQPMVLNGEVDFGIGPKATQIFSKKLNFLFWKSFDRGLLVPREHPLSKKKTVALNDIVKYPLILYSSGKTTRNIVQEVLAQNKISYDVIMELDFAENIKNFVEMGVGVSIIPSFIITQEDKDKLVFINLNKLFGKTEYGIYSRKDKYFTNRMKQFINFFASELLDRLPSKPVGDRGV